MSTVTKITSFRGRYHFLSNFYVSKILPPTLEHHFQAAKTSDPEIKQWIMQALTPGMAKARGRNEKVTDTMIPNWDRKRDEIMLDLVRAKFRDPSLARMLLDTGTAELVEHNDWDDDYWGMIDKLDGTWTGENKLGKILMQVRDELRPDPA